MDFIRSSWSSPGQNTGVGSLSVLQGIFPAQGSKPRSPTLQADSLPAETPGKFLGTRIFVRRDCNFASCEKVIWRAVNETENSES